MIEIILKGMGLGILIAVLVGPVFFLLIDTSINKGFVQALFLALGILASDSTYILLIYFGFAQFSTDPEITKYMNIGGGVMLIAFGLFMLFKKPPEHKPMDMDIEPKNRLKYFIRGYTLNIINPSVCLFWIGSVGLISAQYDHKALDIAIFFFTTVGTVFGIDLLKIYLSKKLSAVISDKVLLMVNRISGVTMALYGAKLLYDKLF
jgi:threonine/homoserine/homoserine lactone efflux protein